MREQNENQGVAPSYSHVYEQRMAAGSETCDAPAVSAAASYRCQKQWVSRFRKRWQGSLARLRKQPSKDSATVLAKAGGPEAPFFSDFWNRKTVPFSDRIPVPK